MLNNYFKIAFRTLFKHKVYSLIHLTGLSIGLWACVMVATVVIDDLSYDTQWTRSNDLFRINSNNKMGEGLTDRFPSTFAGLPPALKKNYPEVESYSQLFTGDLDLRLKENDFDGVKALALHADTTFWNMLDINILQGNPRQYVEEQGNLIVSKTFSEKYFPGQDPVGKIIYDMPKYAEKAKPFLITGVMNDLPYNSHLRADVIWLHKGRVEELNADGGGTFSQNYILMKPGTDMAKFTNKVNKWYKNFVKRDNSYAYDFQPMKNIYLHSDFADRQTTKGNAANIFIFSGVALLLLFIACVNFINLITARAFTRLKETGIRKILSGSRYQIILQFLSETLLIFAIAIIIAALIYQLSLRSVEDFLGHRLVQTFTTNWSLAACAIAIIFVTAILTGLYPAWLISALKPANTLKGVLSSSLYGQNWLRKGLVVVQFSISLIVLLAMIVVRQQLGFMEKKDIGFNKSNLLSIDYISWDGKSDAFKNELSAIPGVTSASVSQWIPTQGAGFMSKDIEDPSNSKNKVKVWYISGDVNLAETLGLKLVKGRLLNKKFTTDAINTDSLQNADWGKYEETTKLQMSMITESAAKILHIKNLNEQIKDANTIPVGIVENFNNESLHEPLKPTVIIAQRSSQYGGMLIRIMPGTEKQVITAIQKLWKKFYPVKLLDINPVDEMLGKQYEAEARLHQLFIFFSSLTMFLSALGIFGLVVQAAEQRSKEVGIRKVLGASVAGIVVLLSKDFVKLVSIAIIISSPIAWYGMDKWLRKYPYRIEINLWIFAIAGLTALLITFLTVSYQSFKTAMMNPVKSLKSE